jgi:hypothetical protein
LAREKNEKNEAFFEIGKPHSKCPPDDGFGGRFAIGSKKRGEDLSKLLTSIG